jgi:hypothetical protein
MPDTDYRRALDAAVREYERAIGDRAALDARIAQLQQTIGTLSRLCGLRPTVPWGLTDACRTVLRNAGQPLSAVEIRGRLVAIGYDLDRYANPLAAIHTVLKRLAEAGELSADGRLDASRMAYRFLGAATATGVAAPRRQAPAATAPGRRRRSTGR